MKILLATIFITLSFFSIADDKEPYRPPYHKVSSKINKTLDSSESVLRFYFPSVRKDTFTILYSIDGIASKAHLKKGAKLYFKTTPGIHHFQFFYDKRFIEVYARIFVKTQHEDLWSLSFPRPPRDYAPNEIQPLKPVIYLYPEKKKEVFVNVKPVGEFTLTYPEIKDGWKIIARPNGELEINGETYNYLFWESKQYQELEKTEDLKGFIIQGENVVGFLKDKLTLAGLTSKEQADFITFWAPRMIHLEKIFIQFQFNEECNKYASLEVSPQPDNIYRLFMTWRKVNTELDVEEQSMQVARRSGFTVIEWGGAEFPSFQTRSLTKLNLKLTE
ncbi:MAG TPA: hypothetical protein EYG86_05265 [Crocinitomicaceae bacterium]|nr:hypothetical protein [Crocinitomicaceae bacterium]